jgi:hypothetical protein
MFSAMLLAVGPPGAAGCVSGSARAARDGAERRARAERLGLGSATVYVLDPALGPVGQSRYRRELAARVTGDQWRALVAAGAVTPTCADELLTVNRSPAG